MTKTDVTPGRNPFNRRIVKNACPPQSPPRDESRIVEQPHLDRLPEKKEAHFHQIEGFFVWLERSDRRSADFSLTGAARATRPKMLFYYYKWRRIGKGKSGDRGKIFGFWLRRGRCNSSTYCGSQHLGCRVEIPALAGEDRLGAGLQQQKVRACALQTAQNAL
jgi:hypothetical protein